MSKQVTDIQIKPLEKETVSKKIETNLQKQPIQINPSPKKKRKKWKIALILLLLAALAGAGVFFLWPGLKKLEEVPSGPPAKENTEVEPLDTESPLNGAWTTKEKAQRRPIAVMVENHPDARPQSGLDKAELVYEAVTEGGITRFLAFYVINDVSEIGPVRSARSYFVKFADEYNAFYAYVGGSENALSLIKELDDFYDLNQFYLGNYFWRDSKRYKPHNVYSTTDKLRKAGESKKWDANAEYDKWSFKDDDVSDERGATSKITIDFSSASYKVDYFYDKESNEYKRNLAGKEHTDRNSKNQIKAKTLIIQNVESWNEDDGIGLKNDGTGKAVIFMDGKKITGTWKKLGRKQRTKFYDEDGEEIKLNRGPIWIEVATSGVKVTDE